jgi:hypothetical protein
VGGGLEGDIEEGACELRLKVQADVCRWTSAEKGISMCLRLWQHISQLPSHKHLLIMYVFPAS